MERKIKRVAFVGGVSTKIGADICGRLVGHGMIVVACGPVDVIDNLAEKIRYKYKGASGELHAIRCNLANEIEILAMFHEIRSRFKRIDVCVNIAGFSSTSTFRECENTELRNILQENILAISICTRESLQLMEENDIQNGHIIQVVQFHSLDPAQKTEHKLSDRKMYKSLNFLIGSYTEALKSELKTQHPGIRVASIYPDPTMIKVAFKGKPEGDFEIIYTNEMPTAKDFADHVIRILITPTYLDVEDGILEL